MSAHFVEQCKHGTVIVQCRCPGPKRLVVRSICPEHCPFAKPPVGPNYPAPGIRVTSSAA